MSIQSEINRISGNVSDALDAIEDKGVTIPSGANSDDLADLIAQITGGGGGVGGITQDQDGYLVLSPDAPSPAPSGGLEFEEGTWTPVEDVARPTISFTNTHTAPPILVMMGDITGTDHTESYSNYGFIYGNFDTYTGYRVPSPVTSYARYGLASYVYRTSANPSQYISGLTTGTGDTSDTNVGYWISNTGFIPSSASTTRYWRVGRTYKWIAVWAPTT